MNRRRSSIAWLVAALGCSTESPVAAPHEPPPVERAEPAPIERAELVEPASVRAHVEHLAGEIGHRALDTPPSLDRAADYITDQWRAQGYEVDVQTYDVAGQTVANLIVEIPGRSAELVVIGAHYDTCANPGADDNGSGVAALLELSIRLRAHTPERTIRLVAFANEEPPYFQDPATMGSSVYARGLRAEGREVAAMLSLESIGYFRDEPDTQHYPAIIAALYPDTGDFIAVVGKNGSRPLVRKVVAALERHGSIPIESIAAPSTITGIDWSDHWSFWEAGWPDAVMITDTAVYRNPNYHQSTDTPDTLDYVRLAELVVALDGTIRELAG